MEDLLNLKKSKNGKTPKQLQETFEREKLKAEEKEKLKLLEKLESHVIKTKKNLPSLHNEKRLMDSLTSMKSEFRKESGVENILDSKGFKTDADLTKKMEHSEKLIKLVPKEAHEFSTETNLDNLLPIGIDKQCCWNCLKIVATDSAVSHYFDDKVIKLKVVNISLI
jgi:hypothetical protein